MSRFRGSPPPTPIASRSRVVVPIAAALSIAALLCDAPAFASNAMLGYDDARHLLVRTGFGPTDPEIRAFAGLTREAAVAKLLRETQSVATTVPPASATDTSPLRPPRKESASEAERKAFVQEQIREGLALGRRPRENLSNGTDHGTANVQFALGGRVAGGFYGEQPRLDRLTGDGNTGYALDFRGVYATVLERWWGLRAEPIVGGRFAPVPFIKA
jgi:hypothetical protein